MFEKLSMDSLTTTMTGSLYRLWDTAKGYFAADSEQDDKDNLQAKTQDNQDDEKVSASLLSTDQQGISWPIPHPKKLLMLASLGLVYYTHQTGYHDNYNKKSIDISYAINGMDITSFVPFQTTSDSVFAIPPLAGAFSQFAMLYSTTSLLSHSYQYNAANLFTAPLSLMTLSSFLPSLPAQTIETEFLKVFGGNFSDYARAVKTTSTGNIVVAGSTDSIGTGSYDALVTKFYANSSLAWMRKLGGDGIDEIRTLALTPDDDIVVAGQTNSFGAGNDDAWVTKIYANGSLAWTRTLGGNNIDNIFAIALTPTNDIVAGGSTESFGAGITDVLVAKLYANGSLAWMCAVGGIGNDDSFTLALTSSNDILVAGATNSFGAGNGDALVIKLDTNGNLVWARAVGGSGNDDIQSLTVTSSDDILMTGSTDSFGAGGYDVLVVKLDAGGSSAWARTLGGSSYDFAQTLALTSNDDIMIGGSTYGFGAGFTNGLVINLDINGNLGWGRALGEIDSYSTTALELTDTDDILVVGYVGAGTFDVLVAKLNANGTISGCNLTRSIQPTLLSWPGISNNVVAPTYTSLNTTGVLRDWTNISTQLITFLSLNLCLAEKNDSINTLSAGTTGLTSNNSPSSSQGSANSLTGASSSSTSGISASISSISTTTANNPSSFSSSTPASQSSFAYIFSVSVSTTPITIEQDIGTTLTSSMFSISGNVPPSQVIYTIIGNNLDIVITVNGLEVTQFTQEDVEGNFVEIALTGVTCGDDYSNELQLEANIAGSNAPAQQVSINLLFDITTCSYAGRLSLFSYRDTHIGFWANNKPKEQAEREARLIQSTADNAVNPIRFRP